MAHVINFNNVDRVYVSDSGDGVTLFFSNTDSVPYFGEEARRIRNVIEKLTRRESGWFSIEEED